MTSIIVVSFASLFGISLLAPQMAVAASAPVMEPLPDAYLSEGQTMSVTVRASDADGDPISLIVTQRPIGASFTDHGNGTASFSWKSEYIGPLSSASSPFVVAFSASDGVLQSSQSILINVQNLNRAPVVSVPDTVLVEVGDTVTILPTVFDPDQDRIIWSAPGSPVGAQLRDSNGSAPVALEWAPETADSGSRVITLVATDQWGLSASASSTVIVSIGPPYTISVGIDTVFPGEIVSLPISLNNREPISGFELAFNYDPSVMTFISALNDTARTSSFESFTFLVGSPALGNLRITAVADLQDTVVAGPLPAGDGPLFYVNFFVSSLSNLAGLFLPVRFSFSALEPPNSNTLTDTLNRVIVSDSIVFVHGGVKMENQSAILRGDINLNGIPFEVADALRFTNYFIDPVAYGFSARQFANSDINVDGIVASIADLVTLLAIVLGDGSANPKVTSSQSASVSVSIKSDHSQMVTRFESSNGSVNIAAALLTFVATSDGTLQSLAIADNSLPEGFETKSHQSADTVRFLVYNGASEISLNGLSELRFDVTGSQGLSNRDEVTTLELVSVELASALGETLQTNLVKTESTVLPKMFDLAQNYPNPFNPETEINYSLSTKSNIKLVIYDILGRTVRTLAQGVAEAGEYSARWDGADEHGSTVASGMYFYRLTVNGQALARKMTLLK
jgi:FlgD Ig-like domain/Cohesin domain